MCVDGVWGSVCGDGWSKGAAFVVCKQMGYVYSGMSRYTLDYNNCCVCYRACYIYKLKIRQCYIATSNIIF